jgi:hypothetical protein
MAEANTDQRIKSIDEFLALVDRENYTNANDLDSINYANIAQQLIETLRLTEPDSKIK